jgi:hypothetical protein
MKKIISSLAIAAIMFFGSCKKNNEVIPGPTDNTSATSLGDFFESRVTPVENFTLTAQTGGAFTGAHGTVVTFPPNAFADQNGNIVTGNVTIHFKEVFSNTEMIYSNVLPISYNNALNSGGQYFIAASKNGQAVQLAPGKSYEAVMPAQGEDPGMMLFLGDPQENPDSLLAVEWQPIVQNEDSLFMNGSFSFNSIDDSYSIELDTMCWSNIDAFTNFTSYFDITITLTGVSGLDNSNTAVYAIFDNENAVWPTGVSGWGSISNNVVVETHLGDIPLHFVVISVVNGQLYSGLLAVTPAPNTPLTIAMTPTTAEDLDTLINSCP